VYCAHLQRVRRSHPVVTFLPAYASLATLTALCSRRIPALRPVAACFAAWAALDAATGPLWLRAGVLVAWPGAAVACAAWGLLVREVVGIPLAPKDAEDRRAFGESEEGACDVADGLGARLVGMHDQERGGTGHGDGERPELRGLHRLILPAVLASVYLNTGIASASFYRVGDPSLYHLALPASRALPCLLAALALASLRVPRTWAQRAAVAPAAGLVVGALLGVWSLWAPSGLDAVRAQWGRLAGAETAVTLAVTAGCVVMAWREATRRADRTR